MRAVHSHVLLRVEECVNNVEREAPTTEPMLVLEEGHLDCFVLLVQVRPVTAWDEVVVAPEE